MTIQPNDLSRFKDTEVINRDGVVTYGLWTRPPVIDPELLTTSDLMRVEIDQSLAGRPDKIADKYYRSPYLEWIIVMYNKPLNTLGWPKAGTVITIPTKVAVNRNL